MKKKTTDKKNRPNIILLISLALAILVLNVYLALPLFRGEYNNNLGSIESAFITDAKFIKENWPNISWNPEWYLGFPFHLSYNPFLPFLLVIIKSILSPFSFSLLYRVVVGIFYCLVPLALFIFVRYLTRNNFTAFITALIYSVLPSFGYVISHVRVTMGQTGMVPWQAMVFANFGEGPHIIALFFALLAATIFLITLRKPSYTRFILASIAFALVILTNWVGYVALFVLFIIILISECALGEIRRKIKTGLLVTIASFGLAAFWVNLSFFKSSFGFGVSGRGSSFISDFFRSWLFFIIFLPAVFIGLGKLYRAKKERQPLFIAVFWFLVLSTVVFSSYYFERQFLPQAHRYLTELNIAASLLVALLLGWLVKKVKIKSLSLVLMIIFSAAVLAFIPTVKKGQDFLFEPHPDIEETYEYEIADWLEQNAAGERVYLTGWSAFWLNYFNDLEQVRGAADPAATHPWWDDASYQIFSSAGMDIGEDGPLAVNWLKALNVSKVVVNDPNFPGRSHYGDYANPEKFEGLLKKIYDDENGNWVYQVDLKNPSLAQVVDKESLEGLREPKSGIDEAAIEAYVDWVEEKDFSKTSFSWLKPNKFEIETDLKEDELISVQITYDSGWRVESGGKRLKTYQDPIGNLVIDPLGQTGKIEIAAIYIDKIDVWLGYLVFIATVVILIFFRKKVKIILLGNQKEE